MILKNKIFLSSLTVTIIIAVIVISVVLTSRIYLNYSGPLKKPITIVIHQGTSSKHIAYKLANENIIRFPYLFYILIKVIHGNKLKAGEYLFEKNISPAKIINLMENGRVITHFVTIPEGLTNFEIFEKLKSIDILTGQIINNYQEGYLLPDTYSYIFGDSRQSILDRMHKNLNVTLDKLWHKRAPDLPYTTKDEALIMASIIEKETSKETERQRIAAVFINRLKKGMKLQADPTVAYALSIGGPPINRALTKNDLKIASSFNTYYTHGLPPNPIANPGVGSIKAALNPIKSDELYFVVNGNGGHNFANNLKQHIKNVQQYRKLKRKNKT